MLMVDIDRSVNFSFLFEVHLFPQIYIFQYIKTLHVMFATVYVIIGVACFAFS